MGSRPWRSPRKGRRMSKDIRYWWQALEEVGDWASTYANRADEARDEIERIEKLLAAAKAHRIKVITDAHARAKELYTADEMRFAYLSNFQDEFDAEQSNSDWDEQDRGNFTRLFQLIFVDRDIAAARKHFRQMDTMLRDSLPESACSLLCGKEPWESR